MGGSTAVAASRYHARMHSPDPASGLQRVEAARYALLRRLTLAMRHRMVVHLQPIGLITQVIERRLRTPDPDMARIGGDMEKVHDYARTAVAANIDVVTWLAPERGQQAALAAAVEECIALLRSHFSFRGFQLLHAPGGAAHTVSRAAVRVLLPAVLFGLTDDLQGPADLEIAGSAATEAPALHVTLRGAPAGDADAVPGAYRPLGWEEVQALAEAEGVTLARSGNAVTLHFSAA